MRFDMVYVRVTRMDRERIANPYHAGSTPVAYSNKLNALVVEW